MLFFSKSIIGLDVDSKEMRAVELKGTAKNPVLVAWGRSRLPENVIKDGRVIDEKLFGFYLNKLLTENGFNSRDIFLGVNNQDIIVRFASFPKVPEDKIRSLIRFQAQEYIPVPLDELELDFVVVGEKKTEDGEFLNVVLVGARKNMLNKFLAGAKIAKVIVKEIDSTMFAIGRTTLMASNNGTFALAAFNHDIGNVLIFREGMLGVARSVSISQAPSWLAYKEEGVESTEREMEIISEVLLSEVRSSVNYFRMQSGETINKLYILGTSSKQEIVSERLAQATGLTVDIPSPYTELENYVVRKKGKSFNSSEYAASISLAVRGLES